MKKHISKKAVPTTGVAGTKAAHSNGTLATSLTPRFVMPTKDDRKRITLIITATLDHNIELFSLATGRMKTEIVIAALSEFLQRHNIDPHQDRRTAVRDLLQVNGSSIL